MRRRVIIVLAYVAAFVLAGTASGAWAYFSSGGLGSGTGATATTQPVVLSPGTPQSELFPGGSTDVVLSVSNPNSSAVRLNSLALDTTQGTGGFAVDAGHSGCDVSALGFATQSNGGSGWTVPAKIGGVNGTLAITLSDPLTMNLAADNACQGAAFTVYLKAGP